MHNLLQFTSFMVILLCVPKTTTFAHTLRSRQIRDVGAILWPHLPEYMEEIDNESHQRFIRSSPSQTADAVMIKDFWRNYGLSADEIQSRSGSELDFEGTDNFGSKQDSKGPNVEKTPNNNADSSDSNTDDDDELFVVFDENSHQAKPEQQTASFRFSSRDDSSVGRDYQEAYNAGGSIPSSHQSPYSQTLNPAGLNPDVQYQHPNYLPLNPPYFGWQSRGGNPVSVGNIDNQNSELAPLYNSVVHPPQIYQNHVPVETHYDRSLSSMSPYMLQKLIMNGNLQNYGTSSPQTSYNTGYPGAYPNPSNRDSHHSTYPAMPYSPSIPQISSSPQQILSYPNPVLQTIPPNFPTYPYS